jgi:peptide/nickel transport system permease protein
VREYLVKRIIIAALVLFIVATLNFVIFQVMWAGDPTATIMNPDFTAEQKEMLRVLYGLRDPLHVRYLKYIGNMFSWRFGVSFQTRTPIIEEMPWRLSNTILLLGTATIGTIIVGISMGVFAGARRGSKADVISLGIGLFADGVPTFFIQMIFLLFFSYLMYLWFGFQVFPARHMTSVPAPTEPLAYMADVAWHLAMPALSLIVAAFGGWALYVRNLMIDALTQDYIVTARAKGLSQRTVLYKHAFKSILPPISTIITLSIPGIITGAIITEYIFTWPGIGSWYIAALNANDYPVVQAVLFIYAVLVIICNLVADLLYGVLDPRIRVGVRR